MIKSSNYQIYFEALGGYEPPSQALQASDLPVRP